jgi:phage shock protein B
MYIIVGCIVGLVMIFALFVAVIVGCAKLLHRLLVSQDEASSGEEAKLLQELNTKMGRLERRIETLETIVTSAGGRGV